MTVVLTLLVLSLFALGFGYVVLNAVFEATRVQGSESRHHVAAMLVVWGVIETGVSAAVIAVALGAST